MIIAHICDLIGWLMNVKLKLNPFNIKVLTMHRWFNIEAAEKDLKFEPIIHFKEGWQDMSEWFKETWLPGFKTSHRTFGLAKQSEDKIDIQDGKKDA